MKYLHTIMAAPLMAICLLGCTDYTTAEYSEIGITDIDRGLVIEEAVDDKLHTLKHQKFMGDAETGVSGGADLYKLLIERAESRFPEDTEFKLLSWHSNSQARNRLEADGYSDTGICATRGLVFSRKAQP